MVSKTLGLLITVFQLGSAYSDCTVSYCENDYCDGNNCTQCQTGYYRFGHVCNKCYLFCKPCGNSECYHSVSHICSSNFAAYDNCSISVCSIDLSVACSSCPDGFYLNFNRCFQCTMVNCKCKSGYECDECLPGYYGPSNFCNNVCPRNCISCSNSVRCDECIPGKYGTVCQSDCVSTCADGTCDKDSGICSTTCPVGQFRQSSGNCSACPIRCTSCISSSNCTECTQSYYWGNQCEYNCTGCTTMCSKVDGCIYGCGESYYQFYNKQRNGFECRRCPPTCRSCNNTKNCTSCESNFWGSSCQFNCTDCAGECDMRTGCSHCNHGYYKRIKETGYQCEYGCENGFWGHNCTIPCSTGCNGDQCNSTTGECLNGCIKSFSGIYCSQIINMSLLCEEELKSTKSCLTEKKQSITSISSTSERAVIGVSVLLGLLLVVSVTGNLIFLKRLRAFPDQRSSLSSKNNAQEEQTNTENYQELNRNGNEDKTYSSLTHDYENSF